MSAKFKDRKDEILAQLAIPEDSYTDFSPKGSVDIGIRSLVDEINQLDGFVTTSSCAGRVAVFLEGVKKGTSEGSGDGTAIAGPGGKGGGQWLFVSHDPVSLNDELLKPGALLSLCQVEDMSNGSDGSATTQSTTVDARFVHLKFEPMILHVLCASLGHAQQAMSAAMAAGFRESGIGGVTGEHPTPLVAVRTAGLAFDCVIGQVMGDGKATALVSEAYLRTMFAVANDRFVTNAERTQRFRDALLRAVGNSPKTSPDGESWEPADVRRERKRAEGLRLREELLRQKESLKAAENAADLDEDDQPGLESGLLAEHT